MTGLVPVADIDTRNRLRPVSTAGVESIIASIGEVGVMKDPIHVRRKKGGQLVLIAGGHRLEAAKRLGWIEIEAKVWVDVTDDWSRMMEIDDNLAGAELNPLDTALFLAARKEVYERLHPEARAKTGAALAAWAWMFKAFTQRDWTIFTQTYAQPVRLGKYHPGATEAEKATLMRALANIAGDMAAMIPESMMIDFIEAANVGAAHALYKERSDWLDQQVSKAVLGQTATTDAVTGGLGSGKEHRQVQEDIERADAKALSAILNRDLVRPFVMLNHGPQKAYPRIIIARPEQEDLAAFSSAIGPMIDRGLEVDQEAIREKFGLAAPKPKAQLMMPIGARSAPDLP
ncbi:MAG: DUF935 family protein, partial [Rhodobacteraceae bacterium]|nr:DUF935 family protein [Paracoccaceae bacterium]